MCGLVKWSDKVWCGRVWSCIKCSLVKCGPSDTYPQLVRHFWSFYFCKSARYVNNDIHGHIIVFVVM